MALLAANIELFADETALSAMQLGNISAFAKDGAVNVNRNSGLSQSARDEIDAQSVAEIVGLPEAKKQIAIVEAIVKTGVPLIKITDPEDPNFGKFVEVGNEGNVVIDPDQL